jgi:hypothetical protein
MEPIRKRFLGMLLQPLNVTIESALIRGLVVVIVREQDDLHVLVKGFLVGAE